MLRSLQFRLLWAFLALMLFASPIPSAQAHLEIVKVGVLAKRGAQGTLARWNLTGAYLSSVIPGHIFQIRPLTFDMIRNAVVEKKIDLILCNPAIYVDLEKNYGISAVTTLSSIRHSEHTTLFGGVIFTRADRDDIKTFSDLKGLRFAAVDKSSLGGWLAAKREIIKAGLNPNKDFRTLTFMGTQDKTVYAVLRREADVGTVRTGTLERMAMEERISLKDFKILQHTEAHSLSFPYPHSTRLYPEWVLARLPHTTTDLAREVDAALLNLPPNHPANTAAEIAGWTAPLNYEPVHELLRELREPPYEEHGIIKPSAIIEQYWPFIAVSMFFLLILGSGSLYILHLYNRLKRSQEALRRSETNYRALFDNASDISFVCDGEFIMDANPTACAKLGYSRKELLGVRMLDLIATKLAEIPCDLEAGRPHTTRIYETAYRRKNGSFLPVELHTNVIEYMGQDAVFHEARDITSRLEAEDALRKSEEKFRALFEKHSVVMLVADADTGNLIEANPAAEKFYGYSREKLRSMHVTDIDAAPAEQIAHDMQQAATRGGAIVHVPHKLANGEIRNVEIHTVHIQIGSTRALYAIIHDITDRKQAEAELRRTLGELQVILDNSEVGILYLRGHRFIAKVNTKFAEIFGYDSPEELLGYNVSLLHISEKAYRDFGKKHYDKLVSGAQIHVEYKLRRKDGRHFWCTLSGAAVDKSPTPDLAKGVIWIVEDITEKRAMEQKLRDANTFQQLILDNSAFGISFVSDHKFTWINHHGAQIAGLSKGDFTGLATKSIFPDEQSFSQFIVDSYPIMARGEIYDGVHELIRMDGLRFWGRLIGKAIDPTKPEKGSLWLFDDITEHKLLEDEMLHINRMQRILLDNSMIGILLIKDRRIEWANQRAAEIVGTTQQNLSGKLTKSIYPSEELYEKIGREAYEAFSQDKVYEKTLEFTRENGEKYWARLSGKTVDPKNPLDYTILLLDDITEQKTLQDNLLQTTRTQQVLLENNLLGIALIENRKFAWVNQKLLNMAGMTEEEMLGASTRIIYDSDELFESFGNSAYETLQKNETFDATIRFRRGDGSSFWCRLMGRALNPAAPSKGSVWMFEDITERRRMEEDLRRMATTDALTGATNRGHFIKKGNDELKRSRRYKRPMTALMLDLDNFKNINDTYGHHAGDEVLKAMVKLCQSTLRETDIFGRLGGEEFAAVLPETPSEGAADVAERLRVKIQEHPVLTGEHKISFTTSIGISALADSDNDLSDILKRADRNLYLAKQKGRNRVESD